MYQKKFEMTVEENVFWAKRNLVDYIWKGANLEGIAITFPETRTLFEGVSVQGKSLPDMNRILQIKHGWQYLLATLEEELTVAYIKKLYLELGKTILLSGSSFHMDGGKKTACRYSSPMAVQDENVEVSLKQILCSESDWTEKALDLMLSLVKQKLFYDGNKQIAMMTANKVLISHGCGILTIAQDQLESFFLLLAAYDEEEEKKEELKLFLYNQCLDGFRKRIS